MKIPVLILTTLICLPGVAPAVTIPTIAGALSIASSSGAIVREGHDLLTHFKLTMKKHGSDLKKALKGTPQSPDPPPTPINPTVPVQVPAK